MIAFFKRIYNDILVSLFYIIITVWFILMIGTLFVGALGTMLNKNVSGTNILQLLFVTTIFFGLILHSIIEGVIYSSCRFKIKKQLAKHPVLVMTVVYLSGGYFASHILTIFAGCERYYHGALFDDEFWLGHHFPIINITKYIRYSKEYKYLLEGHNPVYLYLTGKLAYTLLRNQEISKELNGKKH